MRYFLSLCLFAFTLETATTRFIDSGWRAALNAAQLGSDLFAQLPPVDNVWPVAYYLMCWFIAGVLCNLAPSSAGSAGAAASNASWVSSRNTVDKAPLSFTHHDRHPHPKEIR